jgi:hypothetical protein
MGRFLNLTLFSEEPTVGELADGDWLDRLSRLDPALFYPAAARESLGIVKSSRLEFELYRRAKPPGLGDGSACLPTPRVARDI